MTDQEINKEIAQCMGFEFAPGYPEEMARNESCDIKWEYVSNIPVPNYVGDLNAMHKVELSLPLQSDDYKDRARLWFNLEEITTTEGQRQQAYSWDGTHYLYPFIMSATAQQRAEAFLRTIGKWKEK